MPWKTAFAEVTKVIEIPLEVLGGFDNTLQWDILRSPYRELTLAQLLDSKVHL